MEFGILFTSHPNTEAEPYPHRDVHARVTQQILRADELGYDYAWVAEHHFSNEYGIMPDVFVYAGYLAALTKRIKIGTAVVTLPLANPLRVAENTAFVDILSNGRFALGLGSGYRKYEFDGFGVDFETRRDIQEEALPLLLELFHYKRADHQGDHFRFKVGGHYELFPQALQQPHPPIFLAGATDRSIGVAARMGLGLFLSSWTPFSNTLKACLSRPTTGAPFWLTATNQYNPVVPLSIFLRPSQRQCSGCDLLGRYRVQKRKTLPF